MRIIIIILGVIGLLFLGLNWDESPPDSKIVPREGAVLHSNQKVEKSSNEDQIPLCPKCKKGDKIASINSQNTCTIHEIVAIHL